jgi:hypothetical protein
MQLQQQRRFLPACSRGIGDRDIPDPCLILQLTLVFDSLAGGVTRAAIPRLVFYCERMDLVGWLTKDDERFSPLA